VEQDAHAGHRSDGREKSRAESREESRAETQAGSETESQAEGEAGALAHTEQANRRREEKALALARYAWDRRIGADELAGFDEAVLRGFARAAGVHPPRSSETWEAAWRLLRRKERWAENNPDRPESARAHPEERSMWIKPPIRGWR